MPEPETYMQSRELVQRNFSQNEKTEIQNDFKRRNLHQNKRREPIYLNDQLYENKVREKQEPITTNQTVLLEESYMKMFEKSQDNPNVYHRTEEFNTETVCILLRYSLCYLFLD